MSLAEHIDDILNHDEYKQLASYTHHRPFTTLEHSIRVAQIAYDWSIRLEDRKIRLDTQALIRGALLHDFFLYDWHHLRPDGSRWHGFRHPRIACDNAERCFNLNEKEKDIILSHMWPLTVRMPRSREAFLVMIADKMASIQEFRFKFKRTLPPCERYTSLRLVNKTN
ncbi:HD domain-containing protein [Desulfosporosinus fructosivorans]